MLTAQDLVNLDNTLMEKDNGHLRRYQTQGDVHGRSDARRYPSTPLSCLWWPPASYSAVELGFLPVYRFGWSLGTGNLVPGVFVNLTLVGSGVGLLGENVSTVNGAGIALCILGVVALISYPS
jgi:hypothetical protein